MKFHKFNCRFIILLTGVLLIFGVFATPALADTNQTITIDPIGDHKSGEKFNISGTTTIPKIKKIGLEIFPKKIWDSASEYARVNNSGKIIFREMASTKENFNPNGVKLLRFNADGTQSIEEMPAPADHLNIIIPIEKSTAEKKQWNILIENNEKGTPFSPGTYHVNVWDASNQVQHPGVSLGNGWDILNKKIYPSTARANVWDVKNQKDMEFAEFTIR